MSCCISRQNGIAGGGGGGGTSIPAGGVFWSFASDGGPTSGVIQTTDGVPVFRTWGLLNGIVGATINFYGWFHGVSTDGTQCLFRQQSVGFGLDAAGENSLAPVAAVVNSGYDELGLGTPPWNNLAPNPAGWGGGISFTPGGGIIQVAFNGAAGRTVNWSCLILAFPLNGATIQV